jgi:carbohydrate kinase (thermoresistant glucokinase family)
MGVSGSGKSTIGPRVADALGVEFVDGDDVHSAAAKAQMAAGHPWDDAEREPWLDRIHAILVARATTGVVVACSALKDAYRARLAGALAGVSFVALVAPEEVLEDRLSHRPGHFAGPSLLPSQLEDLEIGPDVVVIDSTQPIGAVANAVVQAVRDQR